MTLFILCTTLCAKEKIAVRLTPTAAELKAAAIPELKEPITMRTSAPNRLKVEAILSDGRRLNAEFDIPIEPVFEVKDEYFKTLRPYKKNVPQYSRQLIPNVAPGMLVRGSVVVSDAPKGAGKKYRQHADFWIDEFLGRIARHEKNMDDRPVYISWKGRKQRIDSVVLTNGNKLVYRKGESKHLMPEPPVLANGEVRLGNIFLPCGTTAVTDHNFFPVYERFYPVKLSPVADRLLPKTMAKLRKGEELYIIAWGDSITDGRYLKNYRGNRWQERVVAGLQKRFPKAKIKLDTFAWGGRGITHFLNAPAKHKFNYKEKLLDRKPDLIIMEFHNDYSRKADDVRRDYEKVLADFKSRGIEWLPMTPPLSTFGGLYNDFPAKAQNNIQGTTWPLVKMLRAFAAEKNLPLAETHERFVRVWRQGIPRLTLNTNHLNHPGYEGMQMIADAVLEVFPEK